MLSPLPLPMRSNRWMKRLALATVAAFVFSSSALALPVPVLVQNQVEASLDQRVLVPNGMYLAHCKTMSGNQFNCVIVNREGSLVGGYGIARLSQCNYRTHTFDAEGALLKTKVYNLCGQRLFAVFP
jgi:hypothetical protein